MSPLPLFRDLAGTPLSTFIGIIPERLTALLILVLLSPVLLILSLCLLLTQGRPLLYAGTRIGLNGKPFTIYKFRTMKVDAEQQLHAVVCTGVDLLTPLGRFMRSCRIDELPQFWNVANGTMAWFGPRPMRHSVYMQNLKTIKNYHKRLWFKPGIFGPTQVVLPHGASKRIRFLFYCISFLGPRPWTFGRKIGLVAATTLSLFLKSLSQLKAVVQTLLRSGSLNDRRCGHRRKPCYETVLLSGDSSWRIIEADEFTLTLAGGGEPPSAGTLVITIPHRRGLTCRRAGCVLEPLKTVSRRPHCNERTVMRYTAASDNASFFIERYLLGKTIL